MKKVLFIAHYFAPMGGAGVQRSAKFVKYLPGSGILPIVLTGSASTPDFWSPEDSSLCDDISPEIPIYRATGDRRDAGLNHRTAFGGPRLQALFATGEQAIAEHRPELIYVSLSPFDDAFLAARLAAHSGLKWIADLRDPWALNEFEVFPSHWHRLRWRRAMSRALRSASLIVMNTPEAARRLRADLPALARVPVAVLTNGFDADDFPPRAATPRNGSFTIVHSGYLHTQGGLNQQRNAWHYRLLGRTERGVHLLSRSHFYLLQALEEWRRLAPAECARTQVHFVGASSPSDRQLATASPAGGMIEFLGYQPHARSLELIRSADLLFLPMHDLPPGRRSTIVPGKTYEYLATGQPILAAVPDGDTRDFAEAAGTAMLCRPTDIPAMVHALRATFDAWQRQAPGPAPRYGFLSRFERRGLAEKLAGLLESVSPKSGAEGQLAIPTACA